jgi:selenocysteine-specific elongation factor
MHVIGTAGHVDHGKSTLIEALTGINPDRLQEERDREMTIDLGFAWMQAPDGEMVGFVDVPGHSDFIENMLAGVGGIDAVLFVVAADEGLMPQSREHLAILDLLQVHGGLIVMTKIDLVRDPEWLDLVENEIRQAVHATVLADAKILRVSARTGAGLPELSTELTNLLASKPARPDHGRPRLPVDRVFSLPGFGTIVTGTLDGGHFSLGDEVEIFPARLHARVRSLQSYNRKETVALPGSRTAINLPGLEVGQIARGAVVALPGMFTTTRWLDVRFRLLPEVKNSLKHNDVVKLFIGTAQLQARVRLLGAEEIRPGEEGWLQLELSAETVAARGDRYILRRPSPPQTLGGGQVVDALPGKRHKRFVPEVIAQLEMLMRGTPADLLRAAVQTLGPRLPAELAGAAGLDQAAADAALARLLAAGELLEIDGEQGERYLSTPAQMAEVESRCVEILREYHRAHPLKKGMPREELQSKAKLNSHLFDAAIFSLGSADRLRDEGASVRLPDHQVRFDMKQVERADRLLALFAASPFSPPAVKECQALAGEDVFEALTGSGRLIIASAEVVFEKSAAERMLAFVRAEGQAHGAINLGVFRDYFRTSRKYALAFLEYLDRSGITERVGDVRRLKEGAPAGE